MADLCVCMRDVISEFNSEIEGSFAFCALMLFLKTTISAYTRWNRLAGSNDLSLHEVELSGNNRYQQFEMNSYPDSLLFIF